MNTSAILWIAFSSVVPNHFIQWVKVPINIHSTDGRYIDLVTWKTKHDIDWKIEWIEQKGNQARSLKIENPSYCEILGCRFGPYEIDSPKGSPYLDGNSLLGCEFNDWEVFCLRIGTPSVRVPISNFICVVHHIPTNKVFYEMATALGDQFIQIKSGKDPILIYLSSNKRNKQIIQNAIAFTAPNGVPIRSIVTKPVT